MDIWQWARMGMVPREGLSVGLLVWGWVQRYCCSLFLLSSSLRAQLHLADPIWHLLFWAALSQRRWGMAQGAHTENRRIQGSRDLQALCKAISVSGMLSRFPAFPRYPNSTAVLAWDGLLSLGSV